MRRTRTPKPPRLGTALVLLLALVFGPAGPPSQPALAAGGCISLTTLGSASTQNFDTLSNTAGSTTNDLTITGWFMTESGGGARDNEQYAVDTGASTTGDTYSYGAAGSTERALGQLRSGTLIPLFGACYTNNTGSTITTLAVAYSGEEWRLGTAGRTDQANFEYSLNATDLVTGSWTNVAALNFVTPDTATTGAKNGNAAADRTALSSTISSLSIANGATFWIRWNDTDASGADDGLAVDDVSLTPSAVVTPGLTINDVSLSEGNAGITSFTFTVSLSAPAGPGGVTFDIATADGTAAAPGDYSARSFTSQTIPAGSSTYSFTVLANGDTTPETNETFFVNVTNVTGATVTDGQGQGTVVNDDAAPNLTINDVSLSEGNAGGTTFTFTVSLSAPAPAGGVTFDIATADGTAAAPGDYTSKSLTSQTIPAGSSTYTFDVSVSGDTTAESDETFSVNVTNVTNAIVTDGQGQGTVVNDDVTKIHDVQGNGASTPIPGATVSVEGVVVASFQGTSKLQGFFLQEEDADADADPNTSEGIFVFCSTCPTAVAEGQRVRATGTVSEFSGMTEVTASTAPSVVVTGAGNNLGLVTPAPVDLPVVGDIDSFYEAREGMLVTFVDTLTVAEYSDLGRFGQVDLYEGGRPFQFTETSAPGAAGYAAHLDDLDRRRVTLDDDDNAQNSYLSDADGLQSVFYPRANGGLSVGTQGVDFFRGGDQVSGLTGVLHWSFPGTGADTWRIRPAAAHPATFTVANPRPAAPPAVGGSIRASGMNLLNYFTTIDATASTSAGPCAPAGTQDCRGADSVAELNRQRERASIAICAIDADVFAFMELENTTPSATITDLLGAVNARCGGAHPYAFVNTGGTLGADAIRVQMIYRTGVLSPVGAPLVDLDPVHSRPPTAQTFDVVDATNPAFGERFTVVANHLKSKGSCPSSGADADQGDGQGCWSATRVQQAQRLLTWLAGTVIPAAGDPDVLLLGDFNSYAKEDPVTTLTAGGFTDLAAALQGPGSYSYLFDGQLGHLDYAFGSASLAPQVTGVGQWHINADEVPLFDYNDEVRDAGESSFEEKPDGSALTPPRVVFQPGTPYRASDHDPVVVGLFPVADLSVTNVDTPDPVAAGANLTYTITVGNAGPDAASAASLSDTLPAGTTFVSLAAPGGWSCTTPAVGAGGTVACSLASMPAGSASFTLVVQVGAGVAVGTVLSNTATVSGANGDPNTGNNSATATTTVSTSADLSVTNVDTPDPVAAGANLTYAITVGNAGPSAASAASLSDTLPAGTTFVSLTSPGGWSCTTPAVGAGGTVACSASSLAPGSASFTLVVQVGAGVAHGSTLSNTATVSSATADPSSGDNSATASTSVVDATAPTVTVEQAAGQADPALSSPVTFDVVFSEPVTGFDAGDVAIAGTAGATTAVVTGGGATYSVAVSGMTGPGTVVVTVAAGAAQDGAGNPSAASTSADNSVTFAPVYPVVTGIARAGADPTNAASVQFSVTFSAAVTGVDAGDFALAAAGVAGASITGVSGSGVTRTVTVSTGSGSGALGLSLADDNSIADSLGSPLGGPAAGDGDFAGPAYAIDRIAPTAGGLAAPDVASAGATAYSFTVTYADNLAVAGASLGSDDVRVTGPGGYSQLATLVGVAPGGDGSPLVATYRITPPGGAWDTADSGAYAVAVEAGAVADTAGNAVAAGPLGGFTVAIGGARGYSIFLPVVVNDSRPDLVATVELRPSRAAYTTSDPVTVVVTVTNRGGARAGAFWVDAYLSPSAPPTAANQPWYERCGLQPCYGLAWAVAGGLEPGQSVTLTSEPGAFAAGYSVWRGTLASGTADVYAYADSYAAGSAAGAVVEQDEANNRAELRGLVVTGPNPASRAAGPRSFPARRAPAGR